MAKGLILFSPAVTQLQPSVLQTVGEPRPLLPQIVQRLATPLRYRSERLALDLPRDQAVSALRWVRRHHSPVGLRIGFHAHPAQSDCPFFHIFNVLHQQIGPKPRLIDFMEATARSITGSISLVSQIGKQIFDSFQPCQEHRRFQGNKLRIQPLIKINAYFLPTHSLNLLETVTGSQDIVVHKDDPVTARPLDLIPGGSGLICPFFTGTIHQGQLL